MTSDLDAYLSTVNSGLHHLPTAEREQATAEIRAHLEEKVQHLRSRGLSPEAATRQAIDEFGDPREIAVSYGPRGAGTIVRRATGEVLLEYAARAGRATGRGVRGAVKWTAVAVGVLLVVGTVVALVALVVYRDEIADATRGSSVFWGTAYAKNERYEGHTSAWTESFVVGPNLAEAYLTANVLRADAGGCLVLVITDPTGKAFLDTTGRCDGVHVDRASVNTPGTWTVSFRTLAFTGLVAIDVQAGHKVFE